MHKAERFPCGNCFISLFSYVYSCLWCKENVAIWGSFDPCLCCKRKLSIFNWSHAKCYSFDFVNDGTENNNHNPIADLEFNISLASTQLILTDLMKTRLFSLRWARKQPSGNDYECMKTHLLISGSKPGMGTGLINSLCNLVSTCSIGKTSRVKLESFFQTSTKPCASVQTPEKTQTPRTSLQTCARGDLSARLPYYHCLPETATPLRARFSTHRHMHTKSCVIRTNCSPSSLHVASSGQGRLHSFLFLLFFSFSGCGVSGGEGWGERAH